MTPNGGTLHALAASATFVSLVGDPADRLPPGDSVVGFSPSEAWDEELAVGRNQLFA
jgi:hypothetical protein